MPTTSTVTSASEKASRATFRKKKSPEGSLKLRTTASTKGMPAFALNSNSNSNSKRVSVFGLVKLGLWDQTSQLRTGLPSAFVVEMSDALSMPRSVFLDNLHLSRSTIEARLKKKTPLTLAEGGAVLRSAKALARAEAVFEDRAAAAAWLKREVRSLGGVTPVSLMDTDSGFEMVMNTLGRIEHGVVA